jgi:hypothetical protein
VETPDVRLEHGGFVVRGHDDVDDRARDDVWTAVLLDDARDT